MRLTYNSSIQLLLCVALGTVCGFVTFVLLDSMRADSRKPFISAVFGDRLRAEINSSSSPWSASKSTDSHDEVPPPPPAPLPRVLAWVMTQPDNHKKRAVHVRDTWGKRVDKLLFMSSAEDAELPSVNLNVTKEEGRIHLWAKARAGFKYVYDHHINEYDWFLKTDDDTFIVVENLRYMLSLYDPQDLIYFGSRFNKFTPDGYMSGGGGFVMSRAALAKVVEEAFPNPTICKTGDSEIDDADIGECLYNVGVRAVDSRDELGRGRFFPFTPEYHLIPGNIPDENWYWDYIYYPMKVGPECCSDTAIGFHYVTPAQMRVMDYLLYRLRPYGAHPEHPFPPHLPPDIKTVPKKTLEKYKKN